MKSAVFTNDDSVSISLINHPFSEILETRDNHEVLFRRINTFLIKHKNKLKKINIFYYLKIYFFYYFITFLLFYFVNLIF